MGELLQPVHLVILFGIFGLFFLVPLVLYILTLQKALEKCAPESRIIEPMMMWLYLVPLVNLVFGFFIVLGLARTLRNEFNRRGVPVADPTPAQSIGLAMCTCASCGLLPIVGVLAGLAHLVLWVVYWMKIAEYSRLLDATRPLPPPLSQY